MTLEPEIQRVRNKIQNQAMHLNPPLTEAAVSAFEQERGVQLPPEYREFLLRIGNGGIGPPAYGLDKLGVVPSDFDMAPPDLAKSFPFTRPWLWEDGDTSLEGSKGDAFCGVLILGTDGCGQYWALVANGPDLGKVWMLCDVGIFPLKPSMTFLEWYEAWLDGRRDWFS